MLSKISNKFRSDAAIYARRDYEEVNNYYHH